MKSFGIAFLIYAVIYLVSIFAVIKKLKKLESAYKSIFSKQNEEIRILKQKLEEAKDNETKAIRIKNWSNDAIKIEYEKKLKEIFKDIEKETRSYSNPVIALTKIKSIIKELSNNLTVRR